MRRRSLTGLYWSVNGEVACSRHAPRSTDPRWIEEHWAPVKVRSGVIHGTMYQYQCQHCAVDGRPVEREARLTELLERIGRHQERAQYHQQEAHYYQLEAQRLMQRAAHIKAAMPAKPSRKRR